MKDIQLLAERQPKNKCLFIHCHQPVAHIFESLSGAEWNLCEKHYKAVRTMENPSLAAQAVRLHIKSFLQ